MSQYSPIRDAFKDLNRLIYDKERFDAERRYREIQHEERMVGLQSQLEQQKFNREMSLKSYHLRKAGFEREGEAIEWNRKQANKQFEFEKTKWKEGKKNREAILKGQQLRNKIAQYNADALADDVAPRPVSINTFAFGDDTIVSNPEWQKRILTHFDPDGSKGLSIANNGILLTNDGTPFVLSKKQMREHAPILTSFNAEYDMTPAKKQQEVTVALGEYNALKNRYNQLKKSYSPMADQAAARVKVAMNKAKAKYEEAQSFFLPQNQIAYLADKEQSARRAANYAMSIGATALAQERINVANKALNEQSKILTEMYKVPKANAKGIETVNIYADPNNPASFTFGDRTVKAGQWAGKVMYDKNNPDAPWIIGGQRYSQLPIGLTAEKPKTADKTGITPNVILSYEKDIRERIAPQSSLLPKGPNQLSAADAAARKFNDFIRKGHVQTKEQLAAAKEAALIWVKSTHDNLFIRYKKAQEKYKNEQMSEEAYNKFIQKYTEVAMKELGYVPSDSFQEQVKYESVDIGEEE